MKKDFHAVSECLHQMAFPHISCSPALAPGAVCCVQLGRGSSFPVQLGFFYGTWSTGDRFHIVRLRQFLQCKSVSRGSGRVSSCTAETAPCVQERSAGLLWHPSERPSITNSIDSLSIQSQHAATKNEVFHSIPLLQQEQEQPAHNSSKEVLFTNHKTLLSVIFQLKFLTSCSNMQHVRELAGTAWLCFERNRFLFKNKFLNKRTAFSFSNYLYFKYILLWSRTPKRGRFVVIYLKRFF